MVPRQATILSSEVALLIASLALGSCAAPKADVAAQATSTATTASTSTGTQVEADNGTSDDSDGDTLGGSGDSGSDSGSESIEDIIKKCGVKPEDLKNPDTVIIDKQIKSFPKIFAGTQAVPLVGDVNFRVTVITKIQLHATLGQTEQTTDFDIDATPTQAIAKARAAVAPNRGSATTINLTTDQKTDLFGASSDWAGFICTLQPTREMRTTKGGFVKKVKFTPALPVSISPKADPDRYDKEIGPVGTEKVFKDIEAEVVNSTDPAMPAGKKVKGTVTLRRINPTIVIDQAGNQQTLQASAAFKLSFDFGDVDTTVGLGLMPSQTLYVDFDSRDLKYVVAETGTPDGGTVVLGD